MQAAEESQGVQLVRQGRAARMEAVHRQLFGGDSDRARDRDQQQQQQPAGGRLSSAAARSPAGSPSRMLASSSTAVRPAGRAVTGADAGSGSPVRLRTLASLPQGGTGPGPARRFSSSSTAVTGSAVGGRGDAGVPAAPGGSVAVRGSAWAAAGQADGPSSNSSPRGQLRASTAEAAAGEWMDLLK